MSILQQTKISFLGAGNMATSLIAGLIADGCDSANIFAADPSQEQRESLGARFSIHTSDNNTDVARQGNVLVLAVKPQVMHEVATQIAEQVQQTKPLVISIAAGVREMDIQKWLGGNIAIVRTMPNTPAMVQSGATALYPNKVVKQSQKDLAETILRAVGLTVWVENEAQLDAVTALSGSGPAYFFLMIEALQEAGVDMGLSEEQAHLLSIQTAFGAAKMTLESSEAPAVLRQRVTSPGGTTERALDILEKREFRQIINQALTAARDRATELATALGDS